MTHTHSKARYGWVPDLPDHRDHLYSVPLHTLKSLPPKVDLRPDCPPVLDQGQLGSCTANAIANAHRFDQMKQGKKDHFPPSRLFIYYNERAKEGTIQSDSGAMIRDGIKSIAKLGVCTETLWPYNDNSSANAPFTQKPSADAYKQALDYQAIAYQRVTQNATQLRGCLAAGYPFVFGFTVYQSFESQAVAKTGIVPLPAQGDSALGGHAVLAVGYDDATQRFTVMNSWNTTWGDQGFFYLPYAYMIDKHLASDFWTVRTVEV